MQLGRPVPRLQTHHRGCCRRGTTRADASRAVTLAPRSLADVRRREEGCTCIGSATTNPELDGDRIRHESPTRDSRSVCWTRARTPYAEPPLSKLLRKYRNNPLAVHSNRQAKTPSKTPQKRLLTALSKPYTSCTPPNSETKLRGRTAKPSYTSSNSETRISPSNSEKQWPPAPREARGSCPTSTWARPSSSSSS